MDRAVEIIGYVNNALFVVLALYCLVQWRRHGTSAAAWAAATFAILGVVVIVGYFTPEESRSDSVVWVRKITIVGIAAFPYALFRFMRAFSSSGRWMDRAALLATAAVGLWALLLPTVPNEGEPRDAVFNIFLAAFLLQWSVLLIAVAVNLWRAGKGQATLPRRRMRLLSLGSVALTLILLIAGAAPDSGPGLQLMTSLMTLGSVLLFFLGFAPPSWLRVAWRRPEQDALYAAAERLVSASTEDEVAQAILPHVAEIIGASAVALFAPDGRMIASTGEEQIPHAHLEAAALEERAETDVITLEFPLARLVVWASPYTPFFGQEEVGLLRQLGVMANLALERAALFASEQRARAELTEANAHLEDINQVLAQRESSLAEAQAIAHIGSFETFPGQERVLWSDEMYRIFGVEPGVFSPTRTSVVDLVHPDDRDRVVQQSQTSVERGEPWEFDARIVRPDGEERVVHVRGQGVKGAEPDRLRGTAQDVTELRRAEREIAVALERETESRIAVEAANREMESFLYTVSHDLNGPLISVMGFLEFLEKDYGDTLPERGRFYLERMEVSTRYMQALIKDLLDLSRVGRVQTEPDDVDLNAVILEVGADVKSRYPGFEILAETLPVVRMNTIRARQLMSNLLNNAAKYTKREDGRVDISATERDGLVEVSVRDNGPGIPEQFREKVFGVFQRLESRDVEGTGIGLAICRRIVENTGGEIWIAPSPDGTDVRFTIPAADPIERQEAAGA